MTIAQWTTDLPTLTRSALLRDPNIDYLLPLFAGMVSNVLPALEQSGRAGKVKIGSYGADVSVMAALQQPGSPVKADIASSNYWIANDVMDAMFRVLTHTPVIDNYKFGYRVFNSGNTKGFNFNGGEQESWYGASYFTSFKKVWNK